MGTQGTFVVLEGGEGSGKDANIARLKKEYGGRADVAFTREPGGTEVGEALRRVLMAVEHTHMVPEAELMLFLASRAQLIGEVVRPALAQGTHVISNRFALSTYAYQVARTGRRDLEPLLTQISEHIGHDLTPHYILLDVPPEVGLERVRTRGEEASRFDLEAHTVHERVRAGYLKAVQAYPHVVLDATRPLDVVYADVQREVARLIGV